MKKGLMLVLALLVVTSAHAVVAVSESGTYSGEAVTIDFDKNLDVTKAGSTIEVDWALYSSATDPCGDTSVVGSGQLFINSVEGRPCFCNSVGVDLSLYDGTTACF